METDTCKDSLAVCSMVYADMATGLGPSDYLFFAALSCYVSPPMVFLPPGAIDAYAMQHYKVAQLKHNGGLAVCQQLVLNTVT